VSGDASIATARSWSHRAAGGPARAGKETVSEASLMLTTLSERRPLAAKEPHSAYTSKVPHSVACDSCRARRLRQQLENLEQQLERAEPAGGRVIAQRSVERGRQNGA